MTKPGPWRITFDTNPDDCNFHCIMCEDHSPHSQTQANRKKEGRPRRRMDIKLIRRILEEAKGTPLKEIIPSTMGEPLLYRHFEEILQMCHDFDVMLNLTTNGSFPGKGAEDWAKLIVPITSDVKISWNGATKETQEKIMLGTNWERVLDNVKTFVKIRDEHAQAGGNRCRVTFQMTFMQSNIHEIADVVRLAASLGVDRVKGHHLWVNFVQIAGLSMRRSPESIEQWNQSVKAAYAAAEECHLPNGEKVLLENIYPLDPSAIEDLLPEGECPFLGKEAWVATDGRFSPCCAPDLLRRKLGDFGTLEERSLTDIWNTPQYQLLQKNYRQHDVCKSCNMRKKVEKNDEALATNNHSS